LREIERASLRGRSVVGVIPLLAMLEVRGLSLADAEAEGYLGLARAVERCRICQDTDACLRWLKWRGHYGRAPTCANTRYVDELKSLRCIKSTGTKPT
jgi:hypothetical protein